MYPTKFHFIFHLKLTADPGKKIFKGQHRISNTQLTDSRKTDHEGEKIIKEIIQEHSPKLKDMSFSNEGVHQMPNPVNVKLNKATQCIHRCEISQHVG